MPEDHVMRAEAAEAMARATADATHRRLYFDIARAWRELAQLSTHARATEARRAAAAEPAPPDADIGAPPSGRNARSR